MPGDQFSCPVHAWSTGEAVAGDILKHRLAPGMPQPGPYDLERREGQETPPLGGAEDHFGHAWGLTHTPGSPGSAYHVHTLSLFLYTLTRGLADGWRGWTVAMKNGVQWAELAGHDYVLDLVSDLELLRDFPRQKSYFIVGAEGPLAARGDTRGYVATCPDHLPWAAGFTHQLLGKAEFWGWELFHV